MTTTTQFKYNNVWNSDEERVDLIEDINQLVTVAKKGQGIRTIIGAFREEIFSQCDDVCKGFALSQLVYRLCDQLQDALQGGDFDKRREDQVAEALCLAKSDYVANAIEESIREEFHREFAFRFIGLLRYSIDAYTSTFAGETAREIIKESVIETVFSIWEESDEAAKKFDALVKAWQGDRDLFNKLIAAAAEQAVTEEANAFLKNVRHNFPRKVIYYLGE